MDHVVIHDTPPHDNCRQKCPVESPIAERGDTAAVRSLSSRYHVPLPSPMSSVPARTPRSPADADRLLERPRRRRPELDPLPLEARDDFAGVLRADAAVCAAVWIGRRDGTDAGNRYSKTTALSSSGTVAPSWAANASWTCS
ncbi:hypothetical protein [Natrinema soli]|uniref:Uncharacterized protein n=1 Tax=Natrinema soli TaxID=1930624 RepID=A0ABD5SVY1_9EURY|nr:hypothetical protein [Natrinema soli]